MLEAVIFDVDGTLVDSVDLHARAWVEAFREFGHEVGFADVRGQIGKGGDQLLPVFLSRDELAAKGEALEERRGAILKQRYLSQVVAFPAVRELLQRLRQAGQRIVLASSAKADELATYKQVARIEDVVDEETSSDDAEHSKPEPDIFQAALRRLGDMPPDRVLVVGDTPYDAQAAARAGLRTIGMLCGGWPEDELRRAGCIAVYRDPADLLAQYATSPLADGATSLLADGATSLRADGATSPLADGATSLLADGATSLRADGATSPLADGATSLRADGATSLRADGGTPA